MATFKAQFSALISSFKTTSAMQKALEATDGARQVASAVCSQENGSAAQYSVLSVVDRVSLGSVMFRSCTECLGKTLFVTRIGDQTISQLYQKRGGAGEGPQVDPTLIIHH